MSEVLDSGTMSPETIAGELTAVRGKRIEIESQRARLDRELIVVTEYEKLLERLLALRKGEPPSAKAASDGKTESGDGLQDASLPPSDSTQWCGTSVESVGQEAVQAVVDELKTAGNPLHISDLMRRLKVRRVRIPGSGTQANLITHLRRDDRLVRPSRGMYALADWGLAAMAPAKQRRRRRRRRSTNRSVGQRAHVEPAGHALEQP
jgi:hypothetical protein